MNSMITVKTAELTGVQLDWAVAMACKHTAKIVGNSANDALCLVTFIAGVTQPGNKANLVFEPSADWRQGGPIIELERIGTYSCEGIWYAKADEHGKFFTTGETLLIAAMRAFVVRKRGLTVEVPEVLP